MPARPHKPRRAPLLIAVLLAGCHFESAGLGDEDAGPGAANAQTSDDTSAATSPGSSSSVTAGADSDSDAVSDSNASNSGSVSDSNSGSVSDSNASNASSTGDVPPPANCGDGIVDPGEQCDGGDCTPVCTLHVCGDGYLGPGEQCDDAGANGDDKPCTSACKNASCGDGLPGPGEACDDGNAINTDACLTGCVPASCGDDFQQIGVETCDLGVGNGTYDGACNVTCNGPGPNCGDGVWDPQHEACDGGGAPPGADCQDGCKPKCEFGKVDCNNNLADGCQGLLTDKNNCGVCGNQCPNVCVLGVCY